MSEYRQTALPAAQMMHIQDPDSGKLVDQMHHDQEASIIVCDESRGVNKYLNHRGRHAHRHKLDGQS